MPGDHVDDGRGHEERGDLAGIVARFQEGLVLFLDALQSADSRTHDDSSAVEVHLRQVQSGVGHGISARGDAVVHELVHAPRFLGRQVFLEFETLHCAAEAAREFSGIVAGDGADAADTLDHIGPGRLEGAAHRRNDAHACDDYPTLAQALLRPVLKDLRAGRSGEGSTAHEAPCANGLPAGLPDGLRQAIRPSLAGR